MYSVTVTLHCLNYNYNVSTKPRARKQRIKYKCGKDGLQGTSLMADLIASDSTRVTEGAYWTHSEVNLSA